MSEQLIFDLRSIIVEGIVLAINDAGIVQTVDVQTHDGVVRSGIEVWQPAGFSGTPEETGRVLLFAVGGDAANLRALPVMISATAARSRARGRCIVGTAPASLCGRVGSSRSGAAHRSPPTRRPA